jgi:uncharacterized protein (TIGR00730 family)
LIPSLLYSNAAVTNQWQQDGHVTDDSTNKPQMTAPAYRLPAADPDFILGDSTRGIRFQLEYQKAEEHLRDWGVETTVVVFGSARVKEGEGTGWYEGARAFASLCSHKGGAKHARKPLYNVIATGGDDVEAPSIGYNITLRHEQEPNSYSTPDLTFRFHYFAMRKMHFAMRAAALVVFPGGFGTMDELFELLTLRQTGKMMKPLPVVLYDRAFWNRTINFQSFVDARLISPEDIDLFTFADTPEEAWAALIDRGLHIPKD